MGVLGLSVVLVLLVAGGKGQGSSEYVGDGCTLNNGVPGTCKALLDCPAALAGIQRRMYPKICSYDRMTAIVCCETTAAVNSPNKSPISDAEVVRRKSDLMCERYASAVFQMVTIENALLLEPYIVNVTECAMSAQNLIVGGHKTEAKEFPHMAVLGYGDADEKDWRCGGSLISERFIITTAHCLVSSGRNVRWALMGDMNYDRTDDEAQPMLAEVIEWILHPDWAQPYNDIALVKLKEDIVFNPFVRPACLNTNATLPAGSHATATGWGIKEWNSEELSADLMKVSLEVEDPSGCSALFKLPRLKKRGFDEDTMICVGDMRGTDAGGWKDTCGGDSGGPLQTYLKIPYCMYNIIAITSYGSKGCGSSRQSAVYTRVDAFIPWIESIVWPN